MRDPRAAASPKAFAVGPTDATVRRTAAGTMAWAIDAALRRCEATGGKPCRLHAIDDAHQAV